MKITAIFLAVLLATGCASAEQKMESKRDYRDAQVEAIKVQAEQRTARETSEQLAEAAMWQSLAEAVKANPESASHFAIVMAVAASNKGPQEASEAPLATIKTERDVTALDWAQVLTGPVLGTVTQVGIAALNTDLQKEISRNNTAVDIVEAEIEGKVYDAIGTMASTPRTSVTVADSASYVGGDSSVSTEANTSTVSTTTTTTTTTTDDDVFVIGTTAEAADSSVDEVIEEISSFGIVDDPTPVVVDDPDDPDDTDDTTDVVDCSFGFSPQPPECQE